MKVAKKIIKSPMNSLLFGLISTPSAFAKVECLIGASPSVNFGTVNVYDGSPDTIIGNVTVTCNKISGNTTEDIIYTLSFADGNSGNINNRSMNNGANSAAYNIYTDTSYNVIYGDGVTGVVITNSISLTKTSKVFNINYPIYGRMPANQSSVAPGLTYIDSVPLTLNY